MAEPTDLPKWDENETNVIPISTELQDDGFALKSKPASGTFNSWFRNVYKWVEWYKEKFISVDSDIAGINAELDNLTVDSIAGLRSITYAPTDGQEVSILGYYASGDGGAQNVYWDSTSIENDNGFTVFKVTALATGRFKSVDISILTVKQSGATGDGVTDDGPFIRAANTYCGSNNIPLRFPGEGVYLIDSNDSTYTDYGIPIVLSNTEWVGPGTKTSTTQIKAGPNVTGVLVGCPVRVDGLKLTGIYLNCDSISEYAFYGEDFTPYLNVQGCILRNATIAAFQSSGFVWSIKDSVAEDSPIGWKIVSNGGQPNTALTMSSCYANRCSDVGYDLDFLRYSNLSALATDASDLAYKFGNLRGVSINGLGAEVCKKGILVNSFFSGLIINGFSFGFNQGVANPLTDDIITVTSGDNFTISGVEIYNTDNRKYLKVNNDINCYILDASIPESEIDFAGRQLKPIILERPPAPNRLLNGDMLVSQRGNFTTATATTVNTYYLDRWKSNQNTVTQTIQQLTAFASLPPGGVGASQRLVATSTGTGRIGVSQSPLWRPLSGQRTVFHAYVKSNNANARLLLYAAGAWQYSSAHSGGGDWEKLTISTTLSTSITSITVYAQISGVDGAAVSITSGDYIEVATAKLEDSDRATKFISEDLLEQKTKCNQYWYQSNNTGTDSLYGSGLASGATSAEIYIPHAEFILGVADTLITGGSFVLYSGIGAPVAVTGIALAGAVSQGRSNTLLNITTAGGLTAGNPYRLYSNGSGAYIGFGRDDL